MPNSDVKMVNTTLGAKMLDRSGSAVAVVRMDPSNTFMSISELLQDYINNSNDEAWREIRRRIDPIYAATSLALEIYDAEVPFAAEVKKQVEAGKRLFFKANWVTMPLIDYKHHGVAARGALSQWEHQAAVMRWFHDKHGISYHMMNSGESGPETTSNAHYVERLTGQKITKQAIGEAKYGRYYGGWGFYFLRKYLSDCHAPGHTDDPMAGYEESLAGHCLPPGKAPHKLLLYDLDYVDESNGRTVPVKNGVNFKELTLHKLLIGGDPANAQDRQDWPGCILINMCKLKVHISELFTNAVKNMGMGFYSMQVNTSTQRGQYRWKYAAPNLKDPTYKLNVPHNCWQLAMDPDTLKPILGKDGEHIWAKTAGMKGSMADAIEAVKDQGVMMLHVSDAIEMTNIHHCGPEGVPTPEGLILVSTDAVALDSCGLRYMFSMVPMEETAAVMKKYGLASDVIQKVPWPVVDGANVVNQSEPYYDSAFSRYHALEYCEKRNLGRRQFYVIGQDLWRGGELASVEQHLGRVKDRAFMQLLTKTMYYSPRKPLMDLQNMIFKYLEADDQLTGARHKQELLAAFDENQDGVIDFNENGKGGSPVLMALGYNLPYQKIESARLLKLRFLIAIGQIKAARREWNDEGLHLGEVFMLSGALAAAYSLSRSPVEKPDPLYPGRSYGCGKWPSLEGIRQSSHYGRVYGSGFPERIDAASPYGLLFQYADAQFNGGCYGAAGSVKKQADLIGNYFKAVENGAAPLPFKLFVPQGFGRGNRGPLLNVEETDDPALVFTAVVNAESWKDFRLSEYGLE